jgi:transcriptional regulator with XRE-family HTH domain
MSQFNLKIGPKIKAFRRQLGLQANKLAEDLSISPSYLNLIEAGKRKIDGDLLLKICERLNIDLSHLNAKSDINLENTISEILDDKLFEDLDILGPEVKDLVKHKSKNWKSHC